MKTEKKQNLTTVLKHYFRKEDVFLIPNILCYFRIILVIVFFVIHLTPITIAGNEHANIFIATGIIALASYTDFIDGFIARTFDQKSNLGKLVDPFADKLLQFGVAVSLCINLSQFVVIFVLFGVFFLKEVTLIIEDFILASRKKAIDGASWYGKVSTFVFYIVLVTLLLFEASLINFTANNQLFVNILCSVAIFFLLLAWILYFFRFIKILKNGETIHQEEKEVKNV